MQSIQQNVHNEIGETDLEASIAPPSYLDVNHGPSHEKENLLKGTNSAQDNVGPAGYASVGEKVVQDEAAKEQKLDALKLESHKFAAAGILLFTVVCNLVSYAVSPHTGSMAYVIVAGCGVFAVLAGVGMYFAPTPNHAVAASVVHYIFLGVALGVVDELIRDMIAGFGAFAIVSLILLQVQLTVVLMTYLRSRIQGNKYGLLGVAVFLALFGIDMGIAYAIGIPIWPFPPCAIFLVGGVGAFLVFQTDDIVTDPEGHYKMYGAKLALVYYVLFVIVPVMACMSFLGVTYVGGSSCSCCTRNSLCNDSNNGRRREY